MYLPGDTYYVQQAETEGLLAETATVCYLVPVILVRQGNPKGIQALPDLLQAGVKVGLGDAQACAIGRNCEQIFQRAGIDSQAIADHVAFRSLTVNELGTNVSLGALDAAIVWDAVAASFAGKTEVVAIPPEQNAVSTVAVGVLRSCRQPELARQFVALLTAAEGQAVFARHHYTTSPPETPAGESAASDAAGRRRAVSNPFSPPSRAGRPVGGLASWLFAASMLAFVVLFVGGWLALFSADVAYTNWDAVGQVLRAKEIQAALRLSLWTSGLSVLIGLLFAIPMGYALSRYRFPGHVVVDSIVDLPILLPPLIIGLSLLVFFRTDAGAVHRELRMQIRVSEEGDRPLPVPVIGFVRHSGREADVRRHRSAAGARRPDARLRPRGGLLLGRLALGSPRRRGGGDSDLDQGLRALRAADGLRRRGADADRSAADHDLPGAIRGPD